MAISQPGAKLVKTAEQVQEDEGEESDEYSVGEEDGEEEDEEGEEDEEDKENTRENDDDGEDEGWVPDGGREPADYSGDEDEEDEKWADSVLKTPEKPPARNITTFSNQAGGSGDKKRAREEESVDETREGKKIKLPTDSGL